MSEQTVSRTVDRYGCACPVAHLTRQMGSHDALGRARQLDDYALAHAIARGVNEQNERALHLSEVLRLILKKVDTEEDLDENELRALLNMAIEYDVRSSNQVFDLGGKVLAAIERSKLYE